MNLVLLGNSLIKQVYHNLNYSAYFQIYLQKIIPTDGNDSDDLEPDIMDDLVVFLVLTYCQIRGKDFCRKIIATEFFQFRKGFTPDYGSIGR